jgi:hypothetical protein
MAWMAGHATADPAAGMTVAWTPTAGRMSEAEWGLVARQPPPGGGWLPGERRFAWEAQETVKGREQRSGGVGRMPLWAIAPLSLGDLVGVHCDGWSRGERVTEFMDKYEGAKTFKRRAGAGDKG